MKVGKFLDSERYNRKGELVITKGRRIGALHYWVSQIALSQEELAAIGLKDVDVKETKRQ